MANGTSRKSLFLVPSFFCLALPSDDGKKNCTLLRQNALSCHRISLITTLPSLQRPSAPQLFPSHRVPSPLPHPLFCSLCTLFSSTLPHCPTSCNFGILQTSNDSLISIECSFGPRRPSHLNNPRRKLWKFAKVKLSSSFFPLTSKCGT